MWLVQIGYVSGVITSYAVKSGGDWVEMCVHCGSYVLALINYIILHVST